MTKRVGMTPIGLVHAHELRQAGLLGAYLFLLITTSVIGKSVRDALFLSQFTTLDMTYAEVQTIIAIGVTTSLYFRLHRSMPLRRMLIATSLVIAIGDSAAWWATTTLHDRWLIRVVYYWIGIQAAIILPQVSMIVRQVLTTRQAKRLSGLVGTGAIFGWIVGGLVTRAAAGHIGTEGLLLVMAALTAISPTLVAGLVGTARDGPDADRLEPDPLRPRGLLHSAAFVWSSPHLRSVAVLVFLSSVVTTIAGLQFKAIVSQAIGPTDRLAAFLGTFTFRAGLLTLAIQILCTSRILRYFGVGIALVVAPLALATGSIGVLVSGTLAPAVFLKGSDQVLRHSIDRAALDLLYVPLSADETLEARTFIDAIVYRIGDGVGALAVAFGATALHLSFPALSVISLVLLVAWVAVTVWARRGYVARLLGTLRLRTIAVGSTGANDTAVYNGRQLADRLFEPDQHARLQALRALNALQTLRPGEHAEQAPLVTALAAEVVGLYRLTGSARRMAADFSASEGYKESVERICRLMTLISPEHDSLSVMAALQSGDPRLRANAIEYLENTLKPQYRKLLVPLLELER